MSTLTVGTDERFTEYAGGMMFEWELVPVLIVRAGDTVRVGDGDGAYVYGARDNGTHVVFSVPGGYVQFPFNGDCYRLIR